MSKRKPRCEFDAPWRAFDDDGKWLASEWSPSHPDIFSCTWTEVQDSNGHALALVFAEYNTPERDANARLISAAPELLEALAGLRASIGRMPVDTSRPGWGEIVAALFEADAALAKAKGEV